MTAAGGAGGGGRPGEVLTRVGLGAGLWLVAVCVLAWPLAAFGWWNPWLAWPIGVVLAVAAGWVVRSLPGVRLGAGPAVALVAVCLGFAVYAGATHSEHVLVRRDAASNLQAAVSLATTHERVVGVDTSVIGGSAALERGDVTTGSSAFYQVGSPSDPAVQPQFLLAPAVVYGYGVWVGGADVAQLLPALVMAVALLLFGLLVAAVVGPWWGVGATVLTAVLFPVLNVARGTYSEQLSLVTLLAAFLAVTLVAGGSAASRDERRLALLAGILLGGTLFARIDALREALLLLPLLAVGAAFAGRWVRPLLLGLGGSTVVAGLAAWALSYRYLGDIAASLVPLLAMAVAAAVVSWGGLALWRRGRRAGTGATSTPAVDDSASTGGNTQGLDRVLRRVASSRPAQALVRRLSDVVGGLVVLVGLGLASRPLWMTVRQDPNDPGARYVAGMQARQGLPVDGGRTYAEHTVDWLAWYAGWAAVVVALVALAFALRHVVARVVAGELVAWAPVLVVGAGSTVLTLLRPGITPDHPWADRRLLIALPFVVALVVAGAAWVARRLESSGKRWGTPLVASLLVVGVGAPAVVATWPFRGVGVERGSLGAVADVCAELEPDVVVLGIDSRSTSEWPQAVRGMCERPFFVATTPVRKDPARLGAVVDELARGAAASGHRLVVLSADSADAIEGLGLQANQVVDLRFPEEEHALDRRPYKTDRGGVRVWLAEVPTGR
ncbi:hypothetical protein [Oryzobacter telluris]|uniref:hypothetical protein n=1 Tax=Oryzobacter telluris TaxID=3149179 RepID=UPI00370D7296